MKQIENLAPLFSFPMFLYWLIFWGFRKIASDVFFPVCIFLVHTVSLNRWERGTRGRYFTRNFETVHGVETVHRNEKRARSLTNTICNRSDEIRAAI